MFCNPQMERADRTSNVRLLTVAAGDLVNGVLTEALSMVVNGAVLQFTLVDDVAVTKIQFIS